jgi:hypothetical protein
VVVVVVVVVIGISSLCLFPLSLLLLLRYFLNDFEMVSFAPVIAGMSVVFRRVHKIAKRDC